VALLKTNEKTMSKDEQFAYGPELWGGIECTINRVKDKYFDQLTYGQHYKRESDIELISELGIKKIRYPILWEKHQPAKDIEIDWGWTERRLSLLREKEIDVIAGLVHHGSGPDFTNLLDDQFPFLLAAYAKEVATKFPWLKYYTPVNEPLTTARFSGLYSLWYPHHSNDRSFIKMLLNELKGVVLSMQEIRKINPEAQLVQTEDLGKTYSTPKLKYQAKFENERRWLTYDFLCGKVNKDHKLWSYFKRLGIPEKNLQFFEENPCMPDIFGFNHYVTSERYIDERLHLYPRRTHGGNKRHRYADVEVVRVDIEEETGIEVLLEEAWERYKKPIAVTEVHLHSHREEQLRWFKYVWKACQNIQEKGVDIRAVTAWALLGSFGWNKLLTRPKGVYEPGVFDLRGGKPRPTALAKFIKQTNADHSNHPVTVDPGWWQRSTRVLYPSSVVKLDNTHQLFTNKQPVLIIGKTGTLGRAFARICHDRSIPFILSGRTDCDIAETSQLEEVINKFNPWAIINTAGFVKVDDAEFEKERCYRDNTEGPRNLAQICQQQGIKLLSFSSDFVFDGNKAKPYVESDLTNPLNIYGTSKARSEEEVLAINPSALVIRTSSLFGPWDECNFLHYVMDNLSKQQQITVADDLIISPTYVPDLVNVSLDLLIDDENGIWHLANKGSISWAELAFQTARASNLDNIFINAVPASELKQKALRPKYSVLRSEKGIELPTFENAFRRFFNEKETTITVKSII
jgi:dTDP-4-dehydrorhamnose reductase